MKPWEKYQELEAQRSPKETGPWDKYATGKERGLIDSALETMDRYGGAPLRAAYGKVQDSMLKRGVPLDVVGAAKAAYDQFGEDPEKAPTAAQLVEQNPLGSVLNKQGFKENFATHPTAVGLRGLMAPFTGWDRSGEIVGEIPRVAAETLVAGETDPLSYVPGAVFEKPIAKGFELGGKAIAGTGKLGAYLAENTTGIPREVWSNYAKRAKEIGKMAKDYVGESRYMNAYTDFRNQVGEAIAGRKNQLNEMIDQGLGGASRGSKISTKGIIEELDNSMRGLHPVTEKSAIDEIQALKNKVRELAPEGKMSPWDAYKLQRYFHDRSMKAFAEGGQIFNPSSQAAKAAKSARYKTTEIVNQFFPDTIKKANQQFVSLHNIDDMIPPSMLDPNGSAAALRRAAIDPNSKERKALSQLSQFLHGDDRLVQQAMDLSTFEKMTNLPINPLSGGGTTSTSRTLLGGGVGLLGEASDDPEMKWAARGAGAMIASPALLKMGLDAGLMVPNAAKAIGGKGGLLEKGIESAGPTMEALQNRMKGAGKAAKEFIKDEEGAFSPDDLFKILISPPKPTKGLARAERINELRKLQAIYQKQGDLEKLSEIESQINNLMSADVFDLKKARGLVGEPKRGLLEPKDNPVGAFPKMRKDGEYIWDGGELKKSVPKLSQTDHVVLSDLSEKVKRGEKLTDKDRQFLKAFQDKADSTDLWQQANEVHLKDRFQQQEIENMPYFRREVETRGNLLPSDHARLKTLLSVVKDNNPKLAEEIRTLLSADVKKSFNQPDKTKGLLTSLDVERGPVKELPEAGEVVANVRPTNSGMRVDKIAKPASLDELERAVLGGEPLSRQEVSELFALSQKTGPASERAHQILNKHDEILARMAKEQDIAYAETQSRKKAAEAERLQKGLIGVDFGGRGGKMPKAKIKSATAPEISREELAEQGRQWLSELDFGDIEPDELIEQLAKMSDDQILKMVNKHWDGGMRGFEEAMNASLKPAPPKKIGSKPKKKK